MSAFIRFPNLLGMVHSRRSRNFGLYSLIFATALLAAAPANAARSYAYGVGSKSCGSWVHERANRTPWGMAQMTQWMLGYISAASAYSEHELGLSNFEGVVAYMDKYCQQNPLDRFESGVRNLIQELRVN